MHLAKKVLLTKNFTFEIWGMCNSGTPLSVRSGVMTI